MADKGWNATKPSDQKGFCAPHFPNINPADFRLADTTHLRIRSRHLVKRTVDCMIGLTAIIVLLPIMISISIAILIEERGPVFFSQKRVGKNRRKSRGSVPLNFERRTRGGAGREFKMYKFRTMHQQSPKYGVSPTSDDDPRITRTGRFLRKTSLDELPQLLNVIKGDMSLVGPRPEMPFIVAKYEPVHKTRLAVKPGITGLWQLRGPRDCFIHEAIEWDLYYIANWSLRLDFAILFETVLFAIRARNR